MDDRLLLIGLERDEIAALRGRIDAPILATELLPKIMVERGRLMAERPSAAGKYLPVTAVVFHGIFEADFDCVTGLALWGGPCLPDAVGMLDCRQRLPCLARSVRVSRFAAMPRGYAGPGSTYRADRPSVAKWGDWHCGENKVRLGGGTGDGDALRPDAPTAFEDFIDGEAVRVVLVGGRQWQVRLAGDDWLKSIHPDDADYMDADPALVADARALADHFGLSVAGVDYMVGRDGTRHLLEVNHIPNVTRFAEVREAYLDHVAAWAGGVMASSD